VRNNSTKAGLKQEPQQEGEKAWFWRWKLTDGRGGGRVVGMVVLLSSSEVFGTVSSSSSRCGWHGSSAAVRNHGTKAGFR
jgi:hypothetical protein